VTLQWTEAANLSGAYYFVEIELGYPNSPNWTPIPQSSGYYGDCKGRLYRTSCTTLNFPGAQPGRWRVTAENVFGDQVGPTPWWTFRFTR
jgi:hypothetical protein